MFDKLLENVEGIAGQLGLPADQLKSVAESLSSKLGAGDDPMQTLVEAAQQHGISIEKLQEMAGSLGIDTNALMAKACGLSGGEGGGLGDIADMAKGLFARE